MRLRPPVAQHSRVDSMCSVEAMRSARRYTTPESETYELSQLGFTQCATPR